MDSYGVPTEFDILQEASGIEFNNNGGMTIIRFLKVYS